MENNAMEDNAMEDKVTTAATPVGSAPNLAGPV